MLLTGNLRLDQKYKYIDATYNDEACTSCDYCDTIIKNVYEIEGEEDKKKYYVGSECVVNLSGLNPLEKLEFDRKLKRKARFIKCLKTLATSITIHPYTTKEGQYFRMYAGKMIRTKWDVNARGYGDYNDEYKNIISKLNIPITICQE